MSESVLVVDDNKVNLTLLARSLERRGFTVTAAEDGTQALEWVGKKDFDLVLLDNMMPGMDGLTVLRTLRQAYSRTALPVIMVTTNAESDSIVEALDLGANDYVTKPVDLPVLMARIRVQLSFKKGGEADTGQTVEEFRTNLAQEKAVRMVRHARQQEALLRINCAIQKMKQPADLGKVMRVCLNEIGYIGLDVQAIAVHRIIDPEQNEIETFRVGPGGVLSAFERRKGSTLTQCWQSGRAFYETDIEESSEFRVTLFRSKFGGLPTRSFVDVPYTLGVISAHSIRPNAFSKQDFTTVHFSCGPFSFFLLNEFQVEGNGNR